MSEILETINHINTNLTLEGFRHYPVGLSALELAEVEDWPLLPCKMSKEPLVKGGCHSATNDLDVIDGWKQSFQTSAWGFPTGQVTGIIVLDFDNKPDEGLDAYGELLNFQKQYGAIPDTLIVSTPSGGFHVYLETKLPIGNSAKKYNKALDIRGKGGYVICAGSVSAAGEYKIIRNSPIADLPEAYADLFLSDGQGKNARKQPLLKDGCIKQGQRNTAMFQYFATLVGYGFPVGALEAHALDFNQKFCKPPLSEDEVLDMAERFCSKERKYSHTAMGNAERYADCYGDKVKCIDQVSFYYYCAESSCWKVDSIGQVQEYAKAMAKELELEAKAMANMDDDISMKQLVDSLKSHANNTLNNPLKCIPIIKSDPKIASEKDYFDSNPNIIGVRGGIIDLETCHFVDGVPEQRVSRQMNVVYDAQAKCPKWDRFLEFLSSNDSDMTAYLARLFGGVGLYGGNLDQVFPIVFGPNGKNGKSTLAGVMKEIFGGYSDVMRKELLLVGRKGDPRHDIADLYGARLAITSEPESSSEFDAAIIKELTGGEAVKGRQNYSDSKVFIPQFMPLFQCNHLPRISNSDRALARRIHLFECCNSVTDKQRIYDLKEQLLEERSGILNWLLKGRMDYLKYGLAPPNKVTEGTEQYFNEMDHFSNFIEEKCVLKEGEKVQFEYLFNAFNGYLALNLLGGVSQPDMIGLLKSQGFRKSKINGCSHYHGLKLK